MKYSKEQIETAVQAGASNMAALYRSLSGKTGKAPGGFSEMIRKIVPGLFGQPTAPVAQPPPTPAEPKPEQPKAEAPAPAEAKPKPTPYRPGSNYEFVALMALSQQEWKRPDLVAALMAHPEFSTRYPIFKEKNGKPFMLFGKPVKYGTKPEQRLNFDLEVVRDPNQQSNRGKTACTFRLDPASKGTRKGNQIVRLVILSMTPHAEIHRPDANEKAQRQAKRAAARQAKAEALAAEKAAAKAKKAEAKAQKAEVTDPDATAIVPEPAPAELVPV